MNQHLFRIVFLQFIHCTCFGPIFLGRVPIRSAWRADFTRTILPGKKELKLIGNLTVALKDFWVLSESNIYCPQFGCCQTDNVENRTFVGGIWIEHGFWGPMCWIVCQLQRSVTCWRINLHTHV